MNIAICDDVGSCNIHLHKLLENYMERRQIGDYKITAYNSGVALFDEYSLGAFDFIFLDIDMPQLSGSETAKKIREFDLKVDIIFVTNMRDQSLMGYNYNAKGFLYKDVIQEDIDSLMDRLIEEFNRKEGMGYYNVKLRFDGGNARLPLADVLYFESRDKNILATTETDSFEFRGQLKSITDELEKRGFIRTHLSYLVNINRIFTDYGSYLLLDTNEKLPISEKYRASVTEALKKKGW